VEQPGRDFTQESFVATAEVVPLVWSAMRDQNINCSELARRTGITKSKLSRILSGRSPIDITEIPKVLSALNVDIPRALLAIGHFGDWNRYYDPDIAFVSDLVKRLPSSLAAARDGAQRVHINAGGIDFIAGQICAMVAENDRQVAERQNTFATASAGRR
jgi:transcriptional regulator with XRE-family HTH domain